MGYSDGVAGSAMSCLCTLKPGASWLVTSRMQTCRSRPEAHTARMLAPSFTSTTSTKAEPRFSGKSGSWGVPSWASLSIGFQIAVPTQPAPSYGAPAVAGNSRSHTMRPLGCFSPPALTALLKSQSIIVPST